METRRNRAVFTAVFLLLAVWSCTQLDDHIAAPTQAAPDSTAAVIVLAQTGLFRTTSDSTNFTLNISKRGPYSFYMSNEYGIQRTQMRIRYLDLNTPGRTGSFSSSWGVGTSKLQIIFPAAGQYFVQLLPYYATDLNKTFKALVSLDTGTLLVPDPNESFPRQDTVSIGYFTDYTFNFHYFEDVDCYKFTGYGDSVTLTINTLHTSYSSGIRVELDLGSQGSLVDYTNGASNFSETFFVASGSTNILRLQSSSGYGTTQFQYGFSIRN